MADYSREQLVAALRKADAAGDTNAARAIARRIKGMQAPQATPRTMEELTPGISTNPTEGMSGFDRFASAYGGALPSLARGAKQLLTDAAGFVAPVYGKPLVQQESANQRAAEEDVRRLEAPLKATDAGFWGGLAGNVAPMLAVPGVAASGLGRLAVAGAEGAGFGGLQPVGAEDSRLTNAAVGGALGAGGQALASGASAAARGVVSRLSPDARALAESADQAGIRLGVGNITENPGLRNVISQMERLPFSGARSRNAANQDAFNEAVGGTFGASGKKITPEVFSEAKNALSNEFERLTARNSLAPTPELMSRLATIRDEAQRLGNSDSAKMVAGQIDELMGKVGADGQIPGRAYQSFDSQLGAKLKGGGDPAFYLGRLRDAVREAMDSSISPADQAAWQAARRQWAAMKTVEPLVAKAVGGDISPTQLIGRTTADKAGKSRMATGRGGELGELARIGQRFLKSAPDSGTADRLAVNLGAAGAVTGAGYYSPEAAGLAALLLGGNRLGLKALSSRGLVQGNSPALSGLSRLVQPAPRLLPAAGLGAMSPAPLDIGTVSGYDRNDPRYRGN